MWSVAGRRESKEPRRGGTWHVAERVLICSFIFLNDFKSDNSEEEVIALVWHLAGDPFLDSVTSTLFLLLLYSSIIKGYHFLVYFTYISETS